MQYILNHIASPISTQKVDCSNLYRYMVTSNADNILARGSAPKMTMRDIHLVNQPGIEPVAQRWQRQQYQHQCQQQFNCSRNVSKTVNRNDSSSNKNINGISNGSRSVSRNVYRNVSRNVSRNAISNVRRNGIRNRSSIGVATSTGIWQQQWYEQCQ